MQVAKGLAGVEVDETAVSLVEGDIGRLSYRGVSIDELCDKPLMEVASWVSRGQFSVDFERALLAASPLSERETATVLGLPSSLHPMQVVVAAATTFETSDAFDGFDDIKPSLRHGFSVAAKLPSLLLTLIHRAPRSLKDDYVSDFVFQLGERQGELARRAFEITQILQLEHSFNAGTFAARVTASTLAPVENCLASAFATLHGVLHGGADQAALETADRVGTADRAKAFVDQCLANGDKIMGMGHREYRVVDPRSKYVKRFAQDLTQGTNHEGTYATLAAIEARFSERMQEQGRSLHPNLEFYKGLVYRALGLSPEYFTATFAMARVFGYLAHVAECWEDNRIIRPAARYVGPPVRATLG